MIQLFRIVGFLLILAGGLIVVTWMIEPLRALWPLLLSLPTPVLIGIAVGFAGLLLLLASIIWERVRDQPADKQLREDLP